MIRGGADKICFVISPGKSDILEYYGAGYGERRASPMWCSRRPRGLCDAIFRAAPLIARRRAGDRRPARHGLVPGDALSRAARRRACRSCSSRSSARSSSTPWSSTRTDGCWRSRSSSKDAASHWIWGAFKMPGRVCTSCSASGASGCAGTSISARWSTPISPRGGEARGRQGRRRLCRCRHAARLPRRDRASVRRGAGRGAPRGRASRSAGRRAARATACTPQAGSDRDECDRDSEPGRDPAPRRGARAVVPQHRPRRRLRPRPTISSATTRP